MRDVLPARVPGQPVSEWIPSLNGVHEKLQSGGTVADIGCGLVASTILMAREYPRSRFWGSDYQQLSIDLAAKRAADADVADRVTFEVADATSFTGADFDLAATFDCLHDMGDPVAAAGHIRQSLKPDGVWLLVEPFAADDVLGNLNPVGWVYYNASTQLCLPNALSQPGGAALGAQAGNKPSVRSPPTQGSPGSAGPRRPRSTSSTKCARDSGSTSNPLLGRLPQRLTRTRRSGAGSSRADQVEDIGGAR